MKFDVYNVCNEMGDLVHRDTVEASNEQEAISIWLGPVDGNGTEVAVPAGCAALKNPCVSDNPAPLTGTLVGDDGIEYEYDFS